MADGQSMTKLELLRSTLVDEHGDFLKGGGRQGRR